MKRSSLSHIWNWRGGKTSEPSLRNRTTGVRLTRCIPACRAPIALPSVEHLATSSEAPVCSNAASLARWYAIRQISGDEVSSHTPATRACSRTTDSAKKPTTRPWFTMLNVRELPTGHRSRYRKKDSSRSPAGIAKPSAVALTAAHPSGTCLRGILDHHKFRAKRGGKRQSLL